MACNTCKKSKTYEDVTSKYENNKGKKNLLTEIRDYTIKIFAFFLLLVIFIPLVIPATIIAIFVSVFTDRGINIVPLGLYIGKKIFKEDKDEDEDDELEDEDYDDLLDEDEYELEDSNEITVIK